MKYNETKIKCLFTAIIPFYLIIGCTLDNPAFGWMTGVSTTNITTHSNSSSDETTSSDTTGPSDTTGHITSSTTNSNTSSDETITSSTTENTTNITTNSSSDESTSHSTTESTTHSDPNNHTCQSPPPNMACIQSGITEMGCVGESCFPDEIPTHSITLPSFFFDKYEVTVGEFLECQKDLGCDLVIPGGGGCTIDKSDKMLPINCVSWSQASSYCSWINKELPTEAQWERVATGLNHQKFPWGIEEISCKYAIIDGCSNNIPLPIGSAPLGISEDGVYDLIGNVGEWTTDWYMSTYYTISPIFDPKGPNSGTLKSARGYSYKSLLNSDVSGWNRGIQYDPKAQSIHTGFRCMQYIK